MKYFKYIIILILLMICTLLYMQLDDYDNISHSLLNDNIETKEKIKEIQNSVEDIKEYSNELQQKIETLYSIIDAREIEIEILEETCIPKQETIQEENTEDTATTEIPQITENSEKSITLENENEVTGFE